MRSLVYTWFNFEESKKVLNARITKEVTDLSTVLRIHQTSKEILLIFTYKNRRSKLSDSLSFHSMKDQDTFVK